MKGLTGTAYVPGCNSSSRKNPDKIFLTVPTEEKLKRLWDKAVRREYTGSAHAKFYCCADHFNLPEVAENYVRIALMGGNVKLKEGVVPHIFNCHKFKARTHRRKSLAAHHIRMRIDAVNEAVNNSKMDDDSNELFTYEISDENSGIAMPKSIQTRCQKGSKQGIGMVIHPSLLRILKLMIPDWRYKTVRQIAQNENKNMWDSQRSQHSHHTDTHCEYNLPCQVIINEENEEISANGVLLEKFNHRTNNMKNLKGQLVFQESMEDTGNSINSYEEYITGICDTVLLEKHEYSQTAEKPCSSGSSAQME
ncbi:hypothetical protein GQR58_026435 [Nymphon striatum]|nr:hypothetical protein GQR58_026435 [Nymphon striatum]